MDVAAEPTLPQAQQNDTDVKSSIDIANAAIGEAANTEHKFQKAISAWRNLNLTNLIPSLDTTASDLANHQRDALVERKDLAQKTKEFRRLDDAVKLTEIKALLKAYQTYIDLISNQSKTVSSAFFQVYSPLSEAPDPYPLLEASVDSLVTSEEVLPKLEAENKSLKFSNNKLTSQLEETEGRLEREIKLRKDAEAARDSKVREVQESWSAVLQEKEDNWTAKERGLEEKLENQDRLMKELKASYEVSQRMGRGDDQEGSSVQNSVSSAELELVSSELDRANIRLAEVEARNEQLRVQLAQSATDRGSAQEAVKIEDDPAFLRLRSENSSLLRKTEAARIDLDSQKRSWQNDIRSLKKEVGALKDDRDKLQAKMTQQNDYDDMKRELEVLKSIEFATGDNEETMGSNENGDTDTAGAGVSDGKNLEQLLLARNKKLNNELTVLRVSHRDLASRLETLQEDLSNTNMELEKSRNLTATLEEDLVRLQSGTRTPNPAMSVAGTSRYPSSSFPARRGRTSPTSSIISGIDPTYSQPNVFDSLRAGEPVGGGSGILPMITAQRDRFKKRITELESETAKNHQTISSLRSEVAALQKDNLNLYEKTRYVSTYSRGQPAASASAYSSGPNPSSVSIAEAGGSPMDRYRTEYESKISPFAAFRGRESVRAYKRMSLPERAVFQITRMVLATRTSRNLFALYCLGLHLLIFGMLYYSSSTEIEKNNAHLSDAAASVLQSAGQATGKGGYADDDWHQEGFEAG